MPVEATLDRFCSGGSLAPPATLVIAAHPSDETIGAAGRLAFVASVCHVVHVTDGAPTRRTFFPERATGLSRTAYARLRRKEALAALSLVGIPSSNVFGLGVRDQHAIFKLAWLAERLAKIVQALRPDVVVTHAYEGGHPDHDATAFAVHAAMGLLARRNEPGASVIEMTGYNDRNGQTVRGEFLPTNGAREVLLALNEDERRQKRSMFAAYASQRSALAAFTCESERFRLAPRYDFTAPPHPGCLHYERFGLGDPGTTWRAFARAVTRNLARDESSR
jgi:LmbE family N-acetylglucosaminyl deacetylase